MATEAPNGTPSTYRNAARVSSGTAWRRAGGVARIAYRRAFQDKLAPGHRPAARTARPSATCPISAEASITPPTTGTDPGASEATTTVHNAP